MGNLVNLLAEEYTEGIVVGNICNGDTFFIFQTAYSVILIIQIAVPFVLIVLGSIDFFKSVVAGDEKEMKQKRKPFVQRIIAAIVIFLIPFIVSLIITTFFKDSEFGSCYSAAKSNRTIKIPSAEDVMNNKNNNNKGNNNNKNNNNNKS